MAEYSVERSTTIAAPAHRVHGLVEDFHNWPQWSPWEDLDPDLSRTYAGPDRGVGARYDWSGNRKAGQGTMEITGSSPEAIDIRLDFRKPIKSPENKVHFAFTPSGEGTAVTWRIGGEQKGVAALFGKVFKMDKMIGPDLEKGLARLKAVAEQGLD